MDEAAARLRMEMDTCPLGSSSIMEMEDEWAIGEKVIEALKAAFLKRMDEILIFRGLPWRRSSRSWRS